jgi:hypothetical protein
MSQALTHVPVQTIAPYRVGERPPGKAARLATLVEERRTRYPLLSSAERREARADYYVGTALTTRSPMRRMGALMLAGVLSPTNLALRHVVKTQLLRVLPRSLR